MRLQFFLTLNTGCCSSICRPPTLSELEGTKRLGEEVGKDVGFLPPSCALLQVITASYSPKPDLRGSHRPVFVPSSGLCRSGGGGSSFPLAPHVQKLFIPSRGSHCTSFHQLFDFAAGQTSPKSWARQEPILSTLPAPCTVISVAQVDHAPFGPTCSKGPADNHFFIAILDSTFWGIKVQAFILWFDFQKVCWKQSLLFLLGNATERHTQNENIWDINHLQRPACV